MVWIAGLAVVLKMLHAYVRCSSVEQNPQLQIDAASRLGVDRIWSERRSSAVHRPELVRLLYSLRRGDALIVWKLDRLARSLSELLSILSRLQRLGVALRSITEPVDTGTPIGLMFVQLLGSFAEFERSMIRERCAAGRSAARARGVQFGRPRVLDRELIAELLRQGLRPAEVARRVGCDRSTISNLMRSGQIAR